MKIRKIRAVILIFLICSLVFAQNPFQMLVEEDGCRTGGASAGMKCAPPNPYTYPGVYCKYREAGETPQPQGAAFATEGFEIPGRQAIPAPGTVEKLLIIPVYFTDRGFDEEHDVIYFETIAEDLKEYYEKNSNYSAGKRGMSLTAVVANPIQSSRSMKYYGEDGDVVDGTNGNIYELAREAVLLLDGAGFDFTPFDEDSDGTIDHIVIIHAGDGQEDVSDPDLIWSHHWAIGDEGQTTQSGKVAERYTMIAESSPLGVLAHEFGHDIGLPDLHDTDGFENGYTFGAGSWDVMGCGAWNHLPGDRPGTCPANLSAWSREYMGWVEPIDTKSDTLTQRTIKNTDGYSDVRRLWPEGSVSSGEYFLVEYRRKIGYDAGLPGEGILVWHVDQSWIQETLPSNRVNAYESRLGVGLEQADGRWDLWSVENTGDAGDPFPGRTDNCNFVGVPYGFNSSNADGSFTYVELKNISVSGSMANAYLMVERDAPAAKPVLKAPTDGISADTAPEFSWSIAYKSEAYILQVSTDKDFNEAATSEYIIYNDMDNLVYWGKGYTYRLPPGHLSNLSTYYWRVAAVNGRDDAGNPENIIWSDRRSFTTCGANPLPVPRNLSTEASESEINVKWDGVDGASGYIVMADGVEKYSSESEYAHSGLYGFTRHTYRVRAVNTAEGSLSDWSDQITVYTLGAPTIHAEILGAVEGSEDGAVVRISLSNGSFRSDGAFNRGTVVLDPDGLPLGVRQGNVVKKDNTTLEVELAGDSIEDYDSDIQVGVTVSKEQIYTGAYYDPTAKATFHATAEPSPAAPDVDFSFDGPNAGKLMGASASMEYSLDGGASYTAVYEENQALTLDELRSITPQDDILVRLKANSRIPPGQDMVIDILPGPAEPEVMGDDRANTVTGLDSSMEFSIDGVIWERCGDSLPDLSGNVTLRVRVAAAGRMLEGDIRTLNFTGDVSPVEEEGGGGKRRRGKAIGDMPHPGIHVDIHSIKEQLTDPDIYQILVDIPMHSEQQVVTIEAEVLKGLNQWQKSLKVSADRISAVFHPQPVRDSLPEGMGSESMLRLTIRPLDIEGLRGRTGYEEGTMGDDIFIICSHAFELRLERLKGSRAEPVKDGELPVTAVITMEGVEMDKIDVNRLGVYHYNEEAGRWDYVGSRYDAEDDVIAFRAVYQGCCAVAEYRRTFADIADHWAKDDIEIMAARHIAKGRSDTEFQPDAVITRAEFQALLVEALQLKGRYGERELVSDDDVSKPDAPVTRQEIVTMLVMALEQKGLYAGVSGAAAEEILQGFDDMKDISDYARMPFVFAVDRGIIRGRDPVRLVPRGQASRAEAVVIIRRALNLLTAL